MDPLRWVLLLIGAAVIAAIWYQGRRNRPVHEETLFETARRGGAGDTDDASTTVGEDDRPPADPGSHRESHGEPEIDLDLGPEELDALLDAPRRPVAGDPIGHERHGEAHESRRSKRPGRPAAPDSSVDEGDAAAEAAKRDGWRDAGRGGSPPTDDERLVVLYVTAAEGERLGGGWLARAFDRLGLEHGLYGVFHRPADDGEPVFSVANIVEPGSFDPDTMEDMETPGLALFTRLPGPVPATEAFDAMVAAARALAEEFGARVRDGQHSTLTRQTEQHLRDELREFEHRRSRRRR